MKHFHTAVPLMMDMPGRDTGYWNEMVKRLSAQECNRVFLVINGTETSFIPLEYIENLVPKLREIGAIFQAAGIEPAIWLGHTIGHGSLFSGDDQAFNCIYGVDANDNIHEDPGVFCPLDGNFANHLARICASLASSGLPILMLDDDFRLSIHDYSYGCFCPLHMEAFRKRTGIAISGEELVKQIRKDIKLRRAWMENNAESLYSLAETIAQAVHRVNPAMRLGVCATPQLTCGDGVDVDKLCRIFAGDTRPFMRVSGAPYWERASEHAGEIIELSRMQKNWHTASDIELFAEGDTFPHNTYVTSASMLEAFTEGLATSGFGGILSYQYSYGDPATTDFAYEKITRDNLDFINAASKFSPAEWQELGFEPALPAGELLSRNGAGDSWTLFRPSFYFCKMAPRLGIPTAYHNAKAPAVLFGREVELYSDGEIREFLKRGAAVDAVAAELLMQRGIDLGIEALEQTVKPHTRDIADDGIPYLLRCFTNGVFYKYRYRQDALVRLCSTFEDGNPGISHLVNSDGSRIVFFPWDVINARWTNFNPVRQRQWQEAYQFLAGEEQPLAIDGKADTRLHLRISPDGNEVVACVQNLSLDVMPLSALRIGADWEVTSWLKPGSDTPVKVDKDTLNTSSLPQMRMCLLRLRRK